MTVLTLEDYYGIPEKEIGYALQREASKMFDSDAIERHYEDGVSKLKIAKFFSKLRNLKNQFHVSNTWGINKNSKICGSISDGSNE